MSDIYSNLQTRVGRKIQKTDTAYKTKIKDFLNDRLQHLYERYMWPELFRETTITATSGQNYIILPREVTNVLYVSDLSNDIIVRKIGFQVFQKRYLNTLDASGNIYNYVDAGYSPLLTQWGAADKVTVVSSSASDTTQKVYIRGYDANGIEYSESISLNGATGVDSTYTYAAFSITNPRTGLTMVSKDADTVGTITVKEKTAGTARVLLGPKDRTVRHRMIRLQRVPSSAQTLYVGYKEALRKLADDGDVPQFECDSLLVQGALVDALKEQRQFQRAALEDQKFEQMLATRLQQEERDSEEDDATIPEVSISTLDIDAPRTF